MTRQTYLPIARHRVESLKALRYFLRVFSYQIAQEKEKKKDYYHKKVANVLHISKFQHCFVKHHAWQFNIGFRRQQESHLPPMRQGVNCHVSSSKLLGIVLNHLDHNALACLVMENVKVEPTGMTRAAYCPSPTSLYGNLAISEAITCKKDEKLWHVTKSLRCSVLSIEN